MKKIILLSLLIFNFQNINSSFNKISEEPILYLYADKLPKFNYDGGSHKYIYSNLKWTNQMDVQGDVLVSFVIQKNGSVKDINIERRFCDPCENEVIRILENMPDWEPGEKDSEKIDIKKYLPIRFTIKK